MWVPGHEGVAGNDKTAKEHKLVDNLTLPTIKVNDKWSQAIL